MFADFRNVFDTVDHHIYRKKPEYYGARGISNKWYGFLHTLVTESSFFQVMVTN